MGHKGLERISGTVSSYTMYSNAIKSQLTPDSRL